MVAGYDTRGPQLFKVDSDGDRCQLRICSVGSGMLNAYGILDTHYKPKMTDEEARALGRRAIMHATYRDAGSGGVCNSKFLVKLGVALCYKSRCTRQSQNDISARLATTFA